MLLPLTLTAAALAGNAVDLEAVTTVGVGQGAPSVTFKGNTHGHIDVSMSCASKRFSLSEDIKVGSRSALELTGLGEGQHRCTGSLTLTTPDGGEGQMPLNLTVAVLPPVALEAPEDQLDLDARSLLLRADRPLARVEVTVYGGEAGERIGGADLPVSDLVELPVSWDSSGEILRIDLIGTDTHGIRSQLTLLPWSYSIPHEDVVFASGKHDVPADEAPKLEAAWGHIDETLRKYGDIVDMELFVAGYTDTVGDAASNQGLSQRRARAIAQWFRSRGFSGPIWVQGFGEGVLAVGTPDETDEPANRRAVYVLAAETPRPTGDLPRANWTRLP